ncbi:MAG: hypothetical protein HS101_03615 [Planctomycetia bacterium]|nr:hypothetical protein [Planctomycetia bacterium]MCC7316048.1 hypothetical protein [Planctomycetota bacterium]
MVLQPVIRNGLGGLIVIIMGSGLGCAKTHKRVCEEPTFSKLAGRWSITYADADEAITGGQNSRGKDLPALAYEKIVFVSILPNGAIDWSRSSAGSVYGIHDLEHVGDECVSRRPLHGRFKLSAAEYTPTRSSVTIERTDPGFYTDSLKEADFALELREDGTARFDCGTFQGLGRPVKTMVLSRHDQKLLRIDNRSRIAGAWTLSPDDMMAKIIIRDDGTFDWTGTVEGMSQNPHQLVCNGDRAFSMIGAARVVAARYQPDSSGVSIETTRQDDSVYVFELNVTRIDHDRTKVVMRVGIRGAASKRAVCTLYRNDKAVQRYESALSDLDS